MHEEITAPGIQPGRWVEMVEALTQALARASQTQTEQMVWQTTSGSWVTSPYPAADQTYIEVYPDGSARMICDACETYRQEKKRGE